MIARMSDGKRGLDGESRFLLYTIAVLLGTVLHVIAQRLGLF